MLTLAFLGILLLVSLCFAAMSLGWSGRIVGLAKVRFGRRLLAAVLTMVLSFVLAAAHLRTSQGLPPTHLLIRSIVFLVLQLVVSWLVLLLFMRPKIGWSFVMLLLWLFFQGVYTVAAVILFKSFVVEAYVIPTNNMGPTLAGPHVRGTCPHCGQPAMLPGRLDPETNLFTLADPWRREDKPPALVESICFSCLRIGQAPPTAGPMEPLDRLLVNKLLKPRRWDLLVFRFPGGQDPGEAPRIYVVRLVGFPGEEVAIKEGAVWIDGVKQEPPEALKGLQYLSHAPPGDDVPFEEAVKRDDGSRREPFRLSAKGYFVLGDFTTRSSDSREWGEVPQENIIGVGTVIYWPPGRWRIFR